MSSRVLKKLHGENDLDIKEQDISDIDNDIGSSGGGVGGARKKQFEMNRYDLVSLIGNLVPFLLLFNKFEAAAILFIFNLALLLLLDVVDICVCVVIVKKIIIVLKKDPNDAAII